MFHHLIQAHTLALLYVMIKTKLQWTGKRERKEEEEEGEGRV